MSCCTWFESLQSCSLSFHLIELWSDSCQLLVPPLNWISHLTHFHTSSIFTSHPFSHLTHSSAATLLISRPSPSQTRTQRITTEASVRSWTPRKKAKQQRESQKCRNVQGQLLKTERKALLGLRSRSCWHDHNIEPIFSISRFHWMMRSSLRRGAKRPRLFVIRWNNDSIN